MQHLPAQLDHDSFLSIKREAMVDISGKVEFQIMCRRAAVEPQIERIGLRLHLLADDNAGEKILPLPFSEAVWGNHKDLWRADTVACCWRPST